MKRILTVTLLSTFIAAPILSTMAAAKCGTGTNLEQIVASDRLPNNLQGLYAKFQHEADLFAAMAINLKTSDGYYIQNLQDADQAKAAALDGCNLASRQTGCIIFAIVRPQSGLVADQTLRTGKSMTAPYGCVPIAISAGSHLGHVQPSQDNESKPDNCKIRFDRVWPQKSRLCAPRVYE